MLIEIERMNDHKQAGLIEIDEANGHVKFVSGEAALSDYVRRYAAGGIRIDRSNFSDNTAYDVGATLLPSDKDFRAHLSMDLRPAGYSPRF